MVPSPILDRFKRNRRKKKKKNALVENRGSEEKSLKNQNHCDFLSCETPHTRLTEPLSQKGVERAGCAPPLQRLESWPLSHRLLISSGFQAAGGSSGCPFQGAVAPVLGRGGAPGNCLWCQAGQGVTKIWLGAEGLGTV